MVLAPTNLDAVCTMAARRDEASTDLQQDAPAPDRRARSSVDVAHPISVAKAMMNPINATRLIDGEA